MSQLSQTYAISHKSAKPSPFKLTSKFHSADLKTEIRELKMPFYNGTFKTLEELEDDYNNKVAPDCFSFAGVLHRWCEPEDNYPTEGVSNIQRKIYIQIFRIRQFYV